MGNKVLNKIKIALLIEIKVIDIKNSKEILEILQKYHDDLIEGGHWKSMTKDIAKYVKVCHKCQLTKTNTLNIRYLPQKHPINHSIWFTWTESDHFQYQFMEINIQSHLYLI